MPKQAKESLYVTSNPTAETFEGRVVGEGDAGAAFVLVGKGGIISDEDVTKFGLKGDGRLTEFDKAQSLAENEARNVATYNRGGNGVIDPTVSLGGNGGGVALGTATAGKAK